MFTPITFLLWISTVLCFILDLWLIKKGPMSYLEMSATLLNVPKKYRVLNLEKLNKIHEFQAKIINGSRLFIIPKFFSHFHLFPIFSFEVDGGQTVDGKIQISILKIIGFVLAICFFYLILSGEWGKNFENALGSFMGLPKVFYFMVIGVFLNIGYGIWAALSILKDARQDR